MSPACFSSGVVFKSFCLVFWLIRHSSGLTCGLAPRPLPLIMCARKKRAKKKGGRGYDEEVAEMKGKMFRISQGSLDSELRNGNCKMLCYSSANKDKKGFTSPVFCNES